VQSRHTRRRLWAAMAVMTSACLCHAVDLRASVVVPLSLSQLVEAADIVVDGTVEAVRAVEGPQGIERLVQLRVTGTWKGTAETVVYVRLAGGQLGRTETRVTGVPAVEPGDRLAWFLVAHPRGGYSVLGLHQGAMRAVAGPDGQARVLAPSRVTGARGDVSRVPRSIDDLASDVRLLSGTGDVR
jgi:hypothetical protein